MRLAERTAVKQRVVVAQKTLHVLYDCVGAVCKGQVRSCLVDSLIVLALFLKGFLHLSILVLIKIVYEGLLSI